MRNEYNFSKAKRAKSIKVAKVTKTFRLDADVIAWLEEQGEKEGMGYQTFLNWYLRKAMANNESFEERLKKLEGKVFKIKP